MSSTERIEPSEIDIESRMEGAPAAKPGLSAVTYDVVEILVLENNVTAIRALADWHGTQETMAEAMDETVFAPQVEHHRQRAAQLRAAADLLEREQQS